MICPQKAVTVGFKPFPDTMDTYKTPLASRLLPYKTYGQFFSQQKLNLVEQSKKLPSSYKETSHFFIFEVLAAMTIKYNTSGK
jgi:hypothetical protein